MILYGNHCAIIETATEMQITISLNGTKKEQICNLILPLEIAVKLGFLLTENFEQKEREIVENKKAKKKITKEIGAKPEVEIVAN